MTHSFNIRLFDGDIWYITVEYDPKTLDVTRAFVPLINTDWDITDQLNKRQLTEIKENLKRRRFSK